MKHVLLLLLVSIAQAQSTWISQVVSRPAAKSANIHWVSSVPATAKVKFGTTTKYGKSTALDSTMITLHKVTVTGLAPKTLYHYKAISTDSDNVQQVMSKDLTFTTAAHAAIVKWNSSSTLNVSYNVYRATAQSGPWTRIATNVVDVEFSDISVSAGQVLWYQMSAVDSSGVESTKTAAIKATVPTP